MAAGEHLHETVSRAWNRLCRARTSFRAAAAKLLAQVAGTTLTSERWLLTLFQELGYGRLLGARAVELEMYDAMQRAIDSGEPYQSRRDPPPGPPANGLPSWPPDSLRPGNWPLHIHVPRSEQ
jgi:hypothetical protein